MQRFSLILLLLLLSTEAFSKVIMMRCGEDEFLNLYKFDNKKEELFVREKGQWEYLGKGCQVFSKSINTFNILEQSSTVTEDSFYSTCTYREKTFTPFVDDCDCVTSSEEWRADNFIDSFFDENAKCMAHPSGGTCSHEGKVYERKALKPESKPETFLSNGKEYLETKKTDEFLVDFIAKQENVSFNGKVYLTSCVLEQ